MIAILCRLYKEKYASQFSLSYMPLVYYYAEKGSSFNSYDIILTNLSKTITIVMEAQLGTFVCFHLSYYLMDIMCTTQHYPKMGWIWKSTDITTHMYCKVLWEHKYMKK